MKKRLIIGLMSLMGMMGLPTYAQHQIDSVFILVNLMDDGSARVRERRDCQMSDQGTEGFITFNNMGDIEVKDLEVFDEDNVDYAVEEEWDVNRSREEKTRRCGYHRTSEGVEVCWGIGKAGKRPFVLRSSQLACRICHGECHHGCGLALEEGCPSLDFRL